MLEKWFEIIQLPLSIEQFRKLPQNRAYKYEYFRNRAWLTPRPKSGHALLNLEQFASPIELAVDERVAIRPLDEADWDQLPPLFAAAFRPMQPFAGLDDQTRLRAAQDCLFRTRDGENGPLISPACRVAVRESDQAVVGGLLTTLIPHADPSDLGAFCWNEPPPADAIQRQLGKPHLTWVFVSPWFAGQGIGCALLAAAVRELQQLGFPELVSTFLLGNTASTLWHWRMGFQLLPNPGSLRRMRKGDFGNTALRKGSATDDGNSLDSGGAQ